MTATTEDRSWMLAVADLIDPPKIDMADLYQKVPNLLPASPRQQRFLDASEWDVFYGGAMGGGKTIALLLIAIRACLEHPGIEVWFFRKTIVQLRGSVISDLRKYFAEGKPFGATWSETHRELRFPNRSWIRFLYAESETDATDYYSQSCQLLIIDERQLMKPSIVDNLVLRVRSGDASIPVLGVRSAGNPGGLGHGSLKKRYVNSGPWDTPIPIPKSAYHRCRRFIPAKLDDNPHLNEDYEGNFDEVDDPTLRQAMRDGNWDVFAGMAFPEWDRDVYVIDPGEIPLTAGVKKAVGVDWGSSSPFCALWGMKLTDELIVIYRELYKAGLTTDEQAQLILASELPDERMPGRHIPVYLDPNSWGAYPDQPRKPGLPPPKSIAADYARNGVPVSKAHNDRIGGKRLIHSHLRVRPDGFPRLLIFATCVNLISQLGDLQRDANEPEDVDHKATDDHAYDACRYLIYGLDGVKNDVGARRNGSDRPVTAGLMKQGF